MSKKVKSIISVALSLIFAFSCFAVTAFAQGEIDSFSINALVNGERYFIEWEKSEADGRYYFYLPAGCDLSSVETKFISTNAIYVGGEKLGYEKKTAAFAGGGEFTLTSGGKEYQVVFLQSENIPAMFIETESGSLDAIHADKSHKEKGTISVVENGEVTVDTTLSSIKGRGNSTWTLAKKPYNIKFDKKIDLFGMGKAKKWSLLASFYDLSFLRNTFTFDFSEDIGLLYSSKSKHVDLYINGEYQGNYLVCESVEVGSTRVDITDLEELNEEANADIDIESVSLAGDRDGKKAGSIKYAEIPNDPEDITGGYLLEFELMSRYSPEVSGFVTNHGQPVVLKSPEYASKAQVEYISSLWQELEDAIYSEDGTNSLGKHYTDYIDLESFAKMFVIEEFTMDIDAGLASCYFIKDAKSDKIIASPVWDFDLALGATDALGVTDDERFGVSLSDPTKLFAGNGYIDGENNATGTTFRTIFAALCRHDDFIAAVKKEWNEKAKPNLGAERIASLRALASEIRASATMDNFFWRRKLDSSYETVSREFDGYVNSLVGFIEGRTFALSKAYGENGALLYYDANGGSGVTFNSQIASVGEKVSVASNSFEGATMQYVFKGWNTERDGSGKSYASGDEIILEGEKTVLYAQWEKVSFFRANLIKLVEFIKAVFAKIQQLFGK